MVMRGDEVKADQCHFVGTGGYSGWHCSVAQVSRTAEMEDSRRAGFNQKAIGADLQVAGLDIAAPSHDPSLDNKNTFG